jgi:hypothetical protein
MNCERIAELLPDYLEGSLSSEQRGIVEEHLQHCATCFDEVAVWKKMSALPTEEPSPESRARFEAMLHAFPSTEVGEPARTFVAARPASGWASLIQWLRTPVGALAWSLALLVIGVGIGTRIGGKDASHSEEIAAMHSELASMKQLVVLSMLTQQSASERLQGVNYTNRDEHLDPQVLAALLRTLRYDNSVDVRLAALDTLSRHANQPQIRKSVVDSLQEQQSPMVQVALIDLLSEWRDPDAAQRLRNFQQIKNLNPTVRQRAEWAVSKLQ